MILLARVQPRQNWTIFGSKEGPNGPLPQKKFHVMDAESVRSSLKKFNLITKNAILMKLTMIMYLHESVNQKALTARKSVFWNNF